MERAVDVISADPRLSQWPFVQGDKATAVILSLPQLAAACAGGVFVLLATLVMRPFFRARALDFGQKKGQASLPASSELSGSAAVTH
jgi:hypothetical protein